MFDKYATAFCFVPKPMVRMQGFGHWHSFQNNREGNFQVNLPEQLFLPSKKGLYRCIRLTTYNKLRDRAMATSSSASLVFRCSRLFAYDMFACHQGLHGLFIMQVWWSGDINQINRFHLQVNLQTHHTPSVQMLHPFVGLHSLFTSITATTRIPGTLENAFVANWANPPAPINPICKVLFSDICLILFFRRYIFNRYLPAKRLRLFPHPGSLFQASFFPYTTQASYSWEIISSTSTITSQLSTPFT